MRQHGYPLLRKGHVFDVGEVFLAALLDSGEEEKTVAVRREHRMRLGVQPLALRRALRMRLVALPAWRSAGRHDGEVLGARHPDDGDLGRVIADPAR